MSETPISRNADLKRLEADGLRLQIKIGLAHHLLIEGVPAVNTKREVVLGTLYSPLELDEQGKTRNPCANHQCWWIGETPCDASGRVMDELIANNGPEPKGDGITTSVSFSRKPLSPSGQHISYENYYEKIWTYIRLIWHEAQAIDTHCDPRTKDAVSEVVQANRQVFRYPDMATTRAGIGGATAKLILKKVAIVGVGGTGAYILDLVAKTPVGEIHIFDGANFLLHHAYRAPGAPSNADLKDMKKVDWYHSIYDRMHMGIKCHPYHVVAENLTELDGFDFVFVAVDDSDARKVILDGLRDRGIPFIDVGMDIDFDQNGALRGMFRVTTATKEKFEHISDLVPLAKLPENRVYRNIQVADLNMANAAFAVSKWKKLFGFYADDVGEHHSLYTVSTHSLTKDERK